VALVVVAGLLLVEELFDFWVACCLDDFWDVEDDFFFSPEEFFDDLVPENKLLVDMMQTAFGTYDILNRLTSDLI